MYFKHEAFQQSQWRSIIDQLSDISVTVDQEVQGPINAYGSPIGANFRVLCRESAIVKAASASAEYKSKHQSSGKNLATWKSALSIMILSRSSSCYYFFLV